MSSRRGASVVALDDLQLWALDRRQVVKIKHIIEMHSNSQIHYLE